MQKHVLKLVAVIAPLLLFSEAQAVSGPRVVIRFSTMYAVDGPFTGEEHPIRNIPGDGLPWRIANAEGFLLSDGTISVSVHGLVFTNDAIVPPALRGINDEEEFRAIVSCLTEDDDATPIANVATKGFRATRGGDALIAAHIRLPNPCVAPIVFVVAADEDDWLAVTGVETH